jgi:hypothetical protein
VTTIEVPENIYEAFAYFWDSGGTWLLGASLEDSEGALPLFLPKDKDPNSLAGKAVEADFAAPAPIVTSSPNRVMWQVPLGMTGMTTTISVYADDEAGHLDSNRRTWYDGIGYRVASLYTPDAPPEPEPEPPLPPLPDPVDPGVTGLVAYYPFEDNVNDMSGNGLNGTIVGDPTFVQGLTKYGKAIDLSNDYVDCGNSPLFDITEAITVAAWVNIRSVPGEWRCVISKGDAAWRISTNSSTQGLHFGFEDGTRGWQAANSTTVLALNEWHHVCGTYDKTNGASIYIDGRVDGTNADKQGITLSTWNVYIGENAQQAGRFWDGQIDEVRLYNRALTNAEVVFLAGK